MSEVTSSDRPVVSVAAYERDGGSLHAAVSECDGLRELSTSDRVLIKPNVPWGSPLSWKAPPYGFATTASVVEEAVRELKDHGCHRLAIGEGSIVNRGLGADTATAFRWAGIDRVARRYGVELVDLNSGMYDRIDLDGTAVSVASRVMEADFLLNLPVLKTHHQATVSLGLKNLKGCLSQQSRRDFHRGGLDRLIALLGARLKPGLTIIDGIYGLERGPEFLGTARRTDLLVASRDVLACDVVGCGIMGVNQAEVGHLREYAELVGSSLRLEDVDVRGRAAMEGIRPFERGPAFDGLFQRTGVTGLSVRPPGVETCSGCTQAMWSALVALCSDNRNAKLDGVELCCGPTAQPTGAARKALLLGDCAIRANPTVTNAIAVPGCPPSVRDMYLKLSISTLGTARGLAQLGPRALRLAGSRLGLHREDFSGYPHYDPAEFRPDDFR
ncbi:MAG: DUF362 domain-containing protein [Dehalococcoidia bacterium]|jgi:uncharacterized protein (DUF362 family)|nr:DUF362 domain-containing protein [Dehalococcoidia bacterium]